MVDAIHMCEAQGCATDLLETSRIGASDTKLGANIWAWARLTTNLVATPTAVDIPNTVINGMAGSWSERMVGC